MLKDDQYNFADLSDETFGAAPRINLLDRPAAWKGFGLDNFNKRIDYKMNYLTPTKYTGLLSPTSNALGIRGNSKPGGISMLSGSKKTGLNMSKVPTGQILGGISSGVQGISSAYSDPGATSAEKSANAISAGANAVSDTLLAIPNPITMIIGAGMKGLDAVGKPIMNATMSNTLKNFGKNKNEELESSSGFSGIGAQAKGVQRDINSYKKAGFFGKLAYINKQDIAGEFMAPGFGMSKIFFGGATGKLARMKREAAKNLMLQKKASEIFKASKDHREKADASVGDLRQRTIQQKYNPNVYNTLQFGRNGMKITPNISPLRLNKYDNILMDNQNVPFVHRILTGDTRSIPTPGRQGYRSTHLIGSYGNYALPKVYENGLPFDNLKFIEGRNMDAAYDTGNAIKFDREQDATDFAENYKKSNLWKAFAKIGKFQEGGKVNVIVNGKLHKELHKLDNKINASDIELSRKGVPVVSMEDGGEVTAQHAEVERDELILTLELTKKLEALEKDGSEEAMIEAGKLLATEIVRNTRDSKNKIIKNA